MIIAPDIMLLLCILTLLNSTTMNSSYMVPCLSYTGRADQSSYHGFTSQSSCKVEKEVYESLFGGEPKPEVKKTILSVVKNQETQGLFLLVPGSSSSDLPSQPLGLGIVDMLSTKLLV